tara:strand:- start:171 stop:473 length:303 start_codon:yes stop_codon:yes gene_type:complete
MSRELLIWWTTQEDCEKIQQMDSVKIPNYIASEFESRCGRNGRGRLWVPDPIGLTSIKWNEDSPVSERCEKSGGIVFYSDDIVFIEDLEGVITDLNLDQI